jgi:hypothetical protein
MALARVEVTGEVILEMGSQWVLNGGTPSNPNIVRASSSIHGTQGLADLVVSFGRQLNMEDGATIGNAAAIVNNGRFEPGLSLGTANIYQYEQSAAGVLGFEIAGPPAGNQDFVHITHRADLAGELEVTFDGYIPNVADVYTIMDALPFRTISGEFDSLTIVTDPIYVVDGHLTYTGSPGTGPRVLLNITDSTFAGDFNDDNAWDCADIDTLVAEIAGGGMNLDFDLNNDDLVNLDDLEVWLAAGGMANIGAPYLPGDATLDGFVDGSDFNVWNTSKFTFDNGWCGGDFNADGATDGSDFSIWNTYKFMSSTASATVPEPALCGLSTFVVGALLLCARRLS